jgi:DNA replication protein DnaC
VGSGKSHLAYGIAIACLVASVPVYAATVATLLDTLRAGYDDGSYTELLGITQSVELLVLDDLGAEKATEWAAEKLYQIINERYASRLPMVVTTNHNPLTPGGNVDERIVSRLTEGARTGHGWSRIVTLPCGDYRTQRRVA